MGRHRCCWRRKRSPSRILEEALPSALPSSSSKSSPAGVELKKKKKKKEVRAEVTVRPSRSETEAAARAVVGGTGPLSVAAEDWATKFLGGLSEFATELRQGDDFVELVFPVRTVIDGEIATRSRLGMQWRVRDFLRLRRVDHDDEKRIQIEGLRLVPIEGAKRAFRGLRQQWIKDGVLRDKESLDIEAAPRDFLDSAWRWWKRESDNFLKTKYWRVCESLIGKQVIRSTASTADLALILVGCACGCPWALTSVVFTMPLRPRPSSMSRTTLNDEEVEHVVGFSSFMSISGTAALPRRRSRQPSSPVGSGSFSADYSPRSFFMSPSSSRKDSSFFENKGSDLGQLHLEYTPLDDDDDGELIRDFKAKLSERILRDSFSSALTVRLSRKFATSAFNFALAFYDLSNAGAPRADPLLLTRLFQASDVQGGATNADRLKGALYWQKDDLTYKMTGDNGRVLWHLRSSEEEIPPNHANNLSDDEKEEDDDDSSLAKAWDSLEKKDSPSSPTESLPSFSETESVHSMRHTATMAELFESDLIPPPQRRPQSVTWSSARHIPSCVLPTCL